LQYTETVYIQLTRAGDLVTLPNGRKALVGGESRGIVVNDATGEVSSEWCSTTGFVEPEPNSIGNAGSCTAFFPNGDALLMWLEWPIDEKGDEGNARWTVMGGSGRFAGATGGGTTEIKSMLGDGGWTGKGTVKITTK